MVRESTEMERSIGSNPRRQSIPAERQATSDRTAVDKNEPLPNISHPFSALRYHGDFNRTAVVEHRMRVAMQRTLISAEYTHVDSDGTFGSTDRTPYALNRTVGVGREIWT